MQISRFSIENIILSSFVSNEVYITNMEIFNILRVFITFSIFSKLLSSMPMNFNQNIFQTTPRITPPQIVSIFIDLSFVQSNEYLTIL